MIVTIDGPAGSGKSTVARKLANKLAFIHLNSGALYRAIGLKAKEQGVDLEDDEAITKLAIATDLRFEISSSGKGESAELGTRLLVDGKDWGEKLFTAEGSRLASKVAVLPELRKVLREVQRGAAKGNSVVLEGRDAGTIVFPNADIKFYLDAATEIRAERRWRDVQAGDASATLESVKRDIEIRDHRDETRPIAPQVAAEDAVYVDTSAMSADEVVETLCEKIEECRSATS